MIANIWFNRNRVKGSDIRKYHQNSVEYRSIINFNILYNIMSYMCSQKKAGHNDFMHKKITIKFFISNILDELISKSERSKYLMGICLSLNTQIK